MEELEQIAQEKEIRERSFNEALLNVQSEKDVREKNEVTIQRIEHNQVGQQQF